FVALQQEAELMQEELDHIERIRRMAEESSFERDAAAIAMRKEPSEEALSEATSGADHQELSAMQSDQMSDEQTKPLLEEDKPETTPRASSPAIFVALQQEAELTQEELDHIEQIRRMAEESSFERDAAAIAMRKEPSKEALSEATSGADHQELSAMQ